MAVKTFEETLASLQLSADEKKLFDSVIAKSPELKDGWLRQDDYSRKSTEIQGKQKRLEDLEAYETQMKPWAEDAHQRIKAAQDAGLMDPEGKPLWETKQKEYEDKIKAAQLGGDMDPVELEKRVKEIVKTAGIALSQEDIKAVLASEGKKMVMETFDSKYKEVETNFNTKTIPTVAGFSAGVAVFASRYEKETGEQWSEEKAKELFDMMGKENNFNAYQVGEKMLAPARDKKQFDQKLEEAVNKRLAALGLPGGGQDGEGRFIPPPQLNQPQGALQSWMERTGPNGEAKPIDMDAFIKSKAVEAGSALAKEGKF